MQSKMVAVMRSTINNDMAPLPHLEMPDMKLLNAQISRLNAMARDQGTRDAIVEEIRSGKAPTIQYEALIDYVLALYYYPTLRDSVLDGAFVEQAYPLFWRGMEYSLINALAIYTHPLSSATVDDIIQHVREKASFMLANRSVLREKPTKELKTWLARKHGFPGVAPSAGAVDLPSMLRTTSA